MLHVFSNIHIIIPVIPHLQISAELTEFVHKEYHLDKSLFAIAVCGLRETSEHEDDCCVLLELISAEHDDNIDVNYQQSILKMQLELEETFIEKASKKVSKGAKVSYLNYKKKSDRL